MYKGDHVHSPKNVVMKTVIRFVGIRVALFKQSPVVKTTPNWIEKADKKKESIRNSLIQIWKELQHDRDKIQQRDCKGAMHKGRAKLVHPPTVHQKNEPKGRIRGKTTCHHEPYPALDESTQQRP